MAGVPSIMAWVETKLTVKYENPRCCLSLLRQEKGDTSHGNTVGATLLQARA